MKKRLWAICNEHSIFKYQEYNRPTLFSSRKIAQRILGMLKKWDPPPQRDYLLGEPFRVEKLSEAEAAELTEGK